LKEDIYLKRTRFWITGHVQYREEFGNPVKKGFTVVTTVNVSTPVLYSFSFLS